MKICVYGASSSTIDNKYIKIGEELGEEIGKRGHSLVFGGGRGGMMGAAARGVKKSGGKILGISPHLFNVDGILYEGCDELVFTDTMRERKALLEDNSDGFIITPGGIGTFEEFFEVYCLKQLDYLNKPIVLLNLYGYYDGIIALLNNTVKENFMSEKSNKLYVVKTDVKEALDYIENYHESVPKLNELKGIKTE